MCDLTGVPITRLVRDHRKARQRAGPSLHLSPGLHVDSSSEWDDGCQMVPTERQHILSSAASLTIGIAYLVGIIVD